jgi:hypothetical protein
MSLAEIVTNGSGKMSFRLAIAGHPIEFVSSNYLVGTGVDGVIRLAGLNSKSLKWAEKLNPAECKLTANGFTAEVLDDASNRIGNSFAQEPTKTTYLEATCAVGAVGCTLSSGAFGTHTYFYLGSECIYIFSGGGTTTPVIVRGRRGTTDQAHYVDSVLSMSRPEATNMRPSIEGALVRLYAYGDGETGDGAQIWTGVVSMQPVLRDLGVWEIAIDSVLSVFDQKLGADMTKPFSPRGIYYGTYTVPTLRVTRRSAADRGSSIVETKDIYLGPAFYETQDDFCTAVNSAIVAQTATWGVPLIASSPSLKAIPGAAGGPWRLEYTTGAVPYYLDVECYGPLDPFQSSNVWYWGSTGASTTTVAANSVYQVPSSNDPPHGGTTYTGIREAQEGTVPRGWIGHVLSVSPEDQLTIYPDATVTLTTADQVTMAWPAFSGQPEASLTYDVVSWDAGTRSGLLRPLDTSRAAIARAYSSSGLPTVQVSRNYGSNTNIGQVMVTLTTNAPTYAPSGGQPFVTVNHMDTSTTLTNVLSAAGGRAWVSNRNFRSNTDCNLMEMLTEEMKILGMVPSINASGKFVMVPWRSVASTEAAIYHVTAANNLSQRMMPGYELNAYGMLNQISLSTGFDPSSGEAKGAPINVFDCASLARNVLPRVMKMSPRSSPAAGDDSIPLDDIVALAQSWMGILGTSYTTIKVAVPLTAYAVTIGSVVALTISQVPNAASGGRGISDMSGICVGREMAPMEGRITLTVLVTSVRVAGYCPSSTIDTVTATGMGFYEILLLAVQPAGFADTSWWAIGDKVCISQHNVAVPTDRTAVVTGVDTSTRKVTINTLSGAVGAAPLTLEYDVVGAVQDTQRKFCFIASTDDIEHFASGDLPARQLGG